MPRERTVVMPARDEAVCIVEMVNSWRKVPAEVGMPCRIFDEGSRDPAAEKRTSLRHGVETAGHIVPGGPGRIPCNASFVNTPHAVLGEERFR